MLQDLPQEVLGNGKREGKWGAAMSIGLHGLIDSRSALRSSTPLSAHACWLVLHITIIQQFKLSIFNRVLNVYKTLKFYGYLTLHQQSPVRILSFSFLPFRFLSITRRCTSSKGVDGRVSAEPPMEPLCVCVRVHSHSGRVRAEPQAPFA